MKKLTIPERKENSISIAEIIPGSDNLIIAYLKDKPVGYFLYNNGYESWALHRDNLEDSEDVMFSNDSLYEAIMEGLAEKYYDQLKVIEFA